MIHRIKDENNEEKFLVVGVFGETVSFDYFEKDENLDSDEGTEMFKRFNTPEEAEAYIEGLEDSFGWNDFTVGESLEYHKKIFGGMDLIKVL